MTSIAKIAMQLKEDPNVTPKNIYKKISVIGLRLEHMVATLMKKNTNFIIESVNTDTTMALPPIYMGIDNKIYA